MYCMAAWLLLEQRRQRICYIDLSTCVYHAYLTFIQLVAFHHLLQTGKLHSTGGTCIR